MRDELELNLLDMIMRILLKWRFIVICILIFGVIFGGLGAYKNLPKDEVVEVIDVEALQQRVSVLEEELSEWDADIVRGAVKTNLSYKEQFEYYVEYFEHSILMSVNANEAPTMRRMYQVSSDEFDSDKTNAIAKTLVWTVDLEDVYEKISKELGNLPSAEYARELVEIGKPEDGTFTINVTAANEEQCNIIMDIIADKVKTSSIKLQETYGSFEVLTMQSEVSFRNSEALSIKQQNARNTFLGINNKINALDDNFSENQFKYYDALLSLNECENGEITENSSQEASETQIVSLINKKYIIIGMFLGAVFACACIVVGYIFSPYLRKKDDLQLVFGIPNYAVTLSNENYKKFLPTVDRVIYRVFKGKTEKDSVIETACVNIRTLVKKDSINNIYLTSTCFDEESQKIVQAICEALKDEVSVKYGKFTETDAKSLEELTNTQLVVLVEKVGVSKHTNIQRLMDICDMHNICVGGSVIVDTY